MLPFTTEQFFAVFAAYNRAIWPLQIAAYLLGIAAVALAVWPRPWSGRAIAAILAAMWAVMGAGYHIGFFAAINPAAYGFGALFVLEAVLLLAAGTLGDGLAFRAPADARGILGAALIAYAIVIYEAIGLAAGHILAASPLFGVAPCPTTIFTIGLLLWAEGRHVALVLAIPILWAAIGGTAAILLSVPQDLGLYVAGGAALWLLIRAQRHGSR